MTEKVLKSEIRFWSNHTFLDVAGEVGLTSVFGKQGCQVLLENEWKKVNNCCRALPDGMRESFLF